TGRSSVAGLHDDASTGREVADGVVGDLGIGNDAATPCGATHRNEDASPERAIRAGGDRPVRATYQRVPSNGERIDSAAKLLNVDAVITSVGKVIVGNRNGAGQVRLGRVGHRVEADVRGVNAAAGAGVVDHAVGEREAVDL